MKLARREALLAPFTALGLSPEEDLRQKLMTEFPSIVSCAFTLDRCISLDGTILALRITRNDGSSAGLAWHNPDGSSRNPDTQEVVRSYRRYLERRGLTP